MFFGIFSSILPYVIAAGFYLVYMLFSFAQPFLQKAFSKDKVEEEKIVTIRESSSEINKEKTYYYEEHSVDESFTTQQTLKYVFKVPECSDQISPPLLSFHSHQLSFSLFSFLLPAC